VFYVLLSAVIFGLLEGVTEWLPISSTGHLILLEGVLKLPLSPAALELFEVAIQLGAILAVAVLYRRRLFPPKGAERRAALALWGKVIVATLPAAVIGFWLDEVIDTYLHTPAVIAAALIFYGILFLFSGSWQRRHPVGRSVGELSFWGALGIGCFQALSLVPGTSRSGATMLGGMLLGLSTTAAAEFSFFLGLPTMMGAGALKICKLIAAGYCLTATEWLVLTVGAAVAFFTSLAVIRYLLELVRRHSLLPFGVYRILLGIAITVFCFLK